MVSVGIAVITHKAKHHLPFCLPPLINSCLAPRVLVVNSSSNDGTVELAQHLGAETLVIPRAEFNHGATRELARKHLNTDIVVMITPDAYAVNSEMVEQLIAPLKAGKASVSYARQLPHDNAKFFESFAREFNYPANSQLRSIDDVSTHGVYTIFCSDSCAAYVNKTLDEIGGFSHVLTGEDTIAVAKLLQKGHKIAYVANACVKHSHTYSLRQEFQRHFDTGLARQTCKEIIAFAGKDQKRGKKYVRTLFMRLIKEKPHYIPYAILQTGVKWLGYKIGTHSVNAPLWIKKFFSAQDFYWINKSV